VGGGSEGGEGVMPGGELKMRMVMSKELRATFREVREALKEHKVQADAIVKILADLDGRLRKLERKMGERA
jgi:hypothetical protein